MLSTKSKFALVALNGRLYRTEKAPYETEDRVAQRGWYIATSHPATLADMPEKVVESHIYLNQADGMKYIDAL